MFLVNALCVRNIEAMKGDTDMAQEIKFAIEPLEVDDGVFTAVKTVIEGFFRQPAYKRYPFDGRWDGRKYIFYVRLSWMSGFIGELFDKILRQFPQVHFKYEWFDLSDIAYLGAARKDGGKPQDTFTSYVGVVMFDQHNNTWEYAEPKKTVTNKVDVSAIVAADTFTLVTTMSRRRFEVGVTNAIVEVDSIRAILNSLNKEARCWRYITKPHRDGVEHIIKNGGVSLHLFEDNPKYVHLGIKAVDSNKSLFYPYDNKVLEDLHAAATKVLELQRRLAAMAARAVAPVL
jgi:hypothetical protein